MLILAMLWLFILLVKYLPARIVLAVHATPCDVPACFSNVVVMQPVLSGDPALESVLAANLGQLSGARFLWLIDNDDQEAGYVARRLQQRYPHAAIHIHYCPPAPEGVNPKAYKLALGYEVVQAEVLLVLDDDAILSAPSLARMLSEMGDNTLVTALPWYQAGADIPSRLLAQFVNDNSALTYLPLLPVARPLSINGMCYVLARTTLARAGGFQPIQHQLTDDLALASHLAAQQVTLVQSTATVQVQTSLSNAHHYWRQMHRWFVFAILLMREKNGVTRLAIGLLQGLHPFLLWAMLVLAFGSVMNAGTLVAALVVRHLVLRNIQLAVQPGIPSRPLYSLLSELLQPVHVLHALVNRTITWRSRRYRIYSNERFVAQ